MPRLSLWNAKKKNDYKFFDRTISEQFRIGGTAFLVHKFEGIHDQGDSEDLTIQSGDGSNIIQDVLLLENRDRKYIQDIYELRGVYNVQDNDFELSQFGLFLSADVLFVSFHINDMISIVGRKLMPGDVLEVPHLRDDTLLDSEDDGINDNGAARKFYQIEDANRGSEGFSPTWFPHIWRIKISPITDSQEFTDILDRDAGSFTGDGFGDGEDTGQTLRDLISTFNDEIKISDAILAEAERQVPFRNLEHAHLYVMVPEFESGLPHMFMTDGEPPNGAELLGCGPAFPMVVDDGDWFLRTDYEPSVLFRREGPAWIRKEVDWKQKLTTANRVLEKFINNRNKTPTSQGLVDSTIGVSKVLAPKLRTPKADL